jgi:hypothetical protein
VIRLGFHQLSLSVEGEVRAVAAAEELLGWLPRATGAGPAELRLVLRASPARPRPAGPRLLYHGIVDVHGDGPDLLLWDGSSLARVAAGGQHIDVEVAEASLRDGYLFAHVLLLFALVLALRWHGLFHLHAGALQAPDGRRLLVSGAAGAGKSTLTLALVEAGCAYLGDDAVFLAAHGEGLAVLALPRPFHVAPRTASAFPRLLPLLGTTLPAGEKRRLDPRAAWPGRDRASLDGVDFLLLPAVAEAEVTSATPISAAEGMVALIESSALLVVDRLPGAAAQLELLRRCADQARSVALGLGRDLLQDPAGTAARLLRQA